MTQHQGRISLASLRVLVDEHRLHTFTDVQGRSQGFSPLVARLIAGRQACLRELTYAYRPDAEPVPATPRGAAEPFGVGKVAREAFGDDMVEHHSNTARVELAAFDAAVTDWERARGLERL
ncbi:hypothetical protein ACVGVM_14100 [Pseudonocardia bannensis]|uniref:Uncharacterized protein n=1 Tax=Pseudonocardia bannensis TaxID=630973 RepID=A0A848DE66_9PSEU|nr:hypothetical protein [Pseudonocardia bannensis]NMH90863.1 hypothetical protein [Pseudonocardia bannensis]